MIDLYAELAKRAGMTKEAWIAQNKSRNAAAFRRIAEAVERNGGRDSHGNTAATFRACAARLEK